jgi:hypothetical protein
MVILVNTPGIKTFSGLQMHTPNPPPGLVYPISVRSDAPFSRDERLRFLEGRGTKRELGFEAEVGLREGLARTVEWFRPRVHR